MCVEVPQSGVPYYRQIRVNLRQKLSQPDFTLRQLEHTLVPSNPPQNRLFPRLLSHRVVLVPMKETPQEFTTRKHCLKRVSRCVLSFVSKR